METILKGRLVSNTGPIIALMLINHLDILRKLFAEVLISEEVNKELLQVKKFPDFKSIIQVTLYEQEQWIKIKSLNNPLNPLISSVLDIGEASVIQLAQEIGADFVLIDERKARKIARAVYKLNVIGTARLLIEAKRWGIIGAVKDLLNQMRAGGYWISDDIVQRILAEAGEQQWKTGGSWVVTANLRLPHFGK